MPLKEVKGGGGTPNTHKDQSQKFIFGHFMLSWAKNKFH